MNARTIPVVAILQEDRMTHETMRYAVRQELDRSWTVFDVFTGQPAKPSTWALVDLSQGQAGMYCTIVNAKDTNRRHGIIQE